MNWDMHKHCSTTPQMDLSLLKQAMRQASHEISAQSQHTPATTHDEKLSACMTLLRSAERGDVVGQLKAAGRYQHLHGIVYRDLFPFGNDRIEAFGFEYVVIQLCRFASSDELVLPILKLSEPMLLMQHTSTTQECPELSFR